MTRRTATDYARSIARKDCQNTSGCKSYVVRGLHRVSRHKAVGKIYVDLGQERNEVRVHAASS